MDVFSSVFIEECIDIDEDSFFNDTDLREKF